MPLLREGYTPRNLARNLRTRLVFLTYPPWHSHTDLGRWTYWIYVYSDDEGCADGGQ